MMKTRSPKRAQSRAVAFSAGNVCPDWERTSTTVWASERALSDSEPFESRAEKYTFSPPTSWFALTAVAEAPGKNSVTSAANCSATQRDTSTPTTSKCTWS